jgi:hypothetical protein
MKERKVAGIERKQLHMRMVSHPDVRTHYHLLGGNQSGYYAFDK